MADRPRIAVDLDGVVYDWQGAFTYLLNKHRYAQLDTGLGWWTDWDTPDRLLSTADVRWVWTEGVELGLFRYGHILKGAVDGLRALADVGDLEVVTHRPKEALRDTLHFVANLPDVFSGVHFLTRAEPKSIIGCDVYLDDAPHVVADVQRAGLKPVLFSQPWNATVRGVTRANGWDDVVPAVTAALKKEAS